MVDGVEAVEAVEAVDDATTTTTMTTTTTTTSTPVPLPPRSPMRNALAIGDLARTAPSTMTPPGSPSFASSPSLRTPVTGVVPPLARFVIEVVDELIQPIMYGGLGGPAMIFSNIPIAEFLKLLSLVYKQNRLECMAAMDAILEYTCQCRHEELLLVVALLSNAQEHGTTQQDSAKELSEPDELELFTMSKVQDTAEYWREIEIHVVHIQHWYRRRVATMAAAVVSEEEEEEEDDEEEGFGKSRQYRTFS